MTLEHIIATIKGHPIMIERLTNILKTREPNYEGLADNKALWGEILNANSSAKDYILYTILTTKFN